METIIAVALTASVALTNANIQTTTMLPPASFVVDENGEASGQLTDGTPFTQTNVVNDFTRLQKFSIDQAWWFISDKGVIGLGEGMSELQALSIYLTK